LAGNFVDNRRALSVEEEWVLMRYINRWILLLFAGSLISSCTCHQQIEQVAGAPTVAQHSAGFNSSRSTVTVPTAGAATTMPQTPPQVAATATPVTQGSVLPPDFPADVPLMKDAEITGIQQLPQNARSVLVRSDQELGKIYEFYQQDLRDKGWVMEQNYQGKDQSFLGFRKGKTLLNVMVVNDPNNPSKRMVSFMYQEDHPPEFGDF
jgi:hypothetical protein